MKQGIHKDFMALIVPRSPSPLCVTISVGNHPKLKIRIPIPKSLIKAIQGKTIEDEVREGEEEDQFKKRKKKRIEKLKEMIPKKVSSILPSVFRSRKSPEIRCSGDGDGGSEGAMCGGERFGEGNFGNGGKESDGVLTIVKQGSSASKLGRLLSNGHRKVKIGWSLRRTEGNFKRINGGETEQEGKEEEPEQEEEEEELCKKRILMGEKCTPLNHSGVLHYDQDGVLLPDILW